MRCTTKGSVLLTNFSWNIPTTVLYSQGTLSHRVPWPQRESLITVKFQLGTTCYGNREYFLYSMNLRHVLYLVSLDSRSPWLRISRTIINIILNSIFKLWPSHQTCLSPMAQVNITRTSSTLSKWSAMKRQLKCCHTNLSRNTTVPGTERIGSFWRANYLLFLLREYCLLHGTFWLPTIYGTVSWSINGLMSAWEK